VQRLVLRLLALSAPLIAVGFAAPATLLVFGTGTSEEARVRAAYLEFRQSTKRPVRGTLDLSSIHVQGDYAFIQGADGGGPVGLERLDGEWVTVGY
jgi:hypothetical protein